LNVVEIKNLTVRYDSVKALDDVSFLINQNDFLGIIGPNGADQKSISKKLVMFHKNLFLKKIFQQP